MSKSRVVRTCVERSAFAMLTGALGLGTPLPLAIVCTDATSTAA